MSATKDPVGSIDATVSEDDADELDDEDSLTRDDIFHILQCRRRRLVLKYLQEHETPAKMTDITERIAAVEHDTTVAALKSKERQRVYIALYQSHLPKLDEEGVIEYRQNRGIVERTGLTSEFDRYLDGEPSMRDPESAEGATIDGADRGRENGHTDEEPGRRWSPLYAGAAGLALASAVGIYANLPGTPLPAGVGVVFAAITVAAVVATRTVGATSGGASGDAASGDGASDDR